MHGTTTLSVSSGMAFLISFGFSSSAEDRFHNRPEQKSKGHTPYLILYFLFKLRLKHINIKTQNQFMSFSFILTIKETVHIRCDEIIGQQMTHGTLESWSTGKSRVRAAGLTSELFLCFYNVSVSEQGQNGLYSFTMVHLKLVIVVFKNQVAQCSGSSLLQLWIVTFQQLNKSRNPTQVANL